VRERVRTSLLLERREKREKREERREEREHQQHKTSNYYKTSKSGRPLTRSPATPTASPRRRREDGSTHT